VTARERIVPLRVQRLAHAKDLALPSYATDGAAGMDLLAAVAEPVVLAPGERAVIPTGLAMAIAPGFVARGSRSSTRREPSTRTTAAKCRSW
jgi:dUTP pyrophosphatase